MAGADLHPHGSADQDRDHGGGGIAPVPVAAADVRDRGARPGRPVKRKDQRGVSGWHAPIPWISPLVYC